MGELIIKTHNFEKSKNQLKVFSEQTQQDLKLRKFEISGGFLGMGNHKVTGYEMNKLVTQVQDYLIDFNTLHTKFIKEFGQVYKALEALDKDYIQAILIAINAAEKANTDVRDAQIDISKTIEVQKKTINALKQFKTRLDSYKHLVDIDSMWHDSQQLQTSLITVSQDVDVLTDKAVHFKKTISTIDVKINSIIDSLEHLIHFKENIENINHIEDVDKMWDDTLKLQSEIISINIDIDNLNENATGQQQHIKELQKFKYTLEHYEHLKDIDEIWERCNTFEQNISSINNVINVNQNQIGTLQIKIQEMQEENKARIKEIHAANKAKIQELQAGNKAKLQEVQKENEGRNKLVSKKIKVAYVLAGTSIGITVIQFVLLAMGMF